MINFLVSHVCRQLFRQIDIWQMLQTWCAERNESHVKSSIISASATPFWVRTKICMSSDQISYSQIDHCRNLHKLKQYLGLGQRIWAASIETIRFIADEWIMLTLYSETCLVALFLPCKDKYSVITVKDNLEWCKWWWDWPAAWFWAEHLLQQAGGVWQGILWQTCLLWSVHLTAQSLSPLAMPC